MSRRRYSHSFIVEAAVKAKAGDPAALDFLICHISREIGDADHHRLAQIFQRYTDEIQAAADRTGVKRDQTNYEMKQAAIKVGKGDPNAILWVRRAMLDWCLKAPYAIWLSLQDTPLSELPKNAPCPEGVIRLTPQII